MIEFKLPDGTIKEFSTPVPASEVVKSISEGLLRAAVCVSLNGELKGLGEVLDCGGDFKVLTFKDEEGKEVYRHTASHVMAQAIKRLYPDAKLAIGPAVKNGFYYDIDFAQPVSLEDFKAIEDEMNKIVKSDFPIRKSVVPVSEAKEMLADEPYKLELLEGIKEDTVSFFGQGEFSDMCRGPHLSSTGRLKAFRLTSIAGAYWRGDSSKKMLTRIYGTAFDKKSDMEEYLARMEEAKKRDHNKLGRELGIFMTEEKHRTGAAAVYAKGRAYSQNHAALGGRRGGKTRLHADKNSVYGKERPLQNKRTLVSLPRRNVYSRRPRGSRRQQRSAGFETYDLSVPVHDLQKRSQELSRSARALQRNRAFIQKRKQRRNARHDKGTSVYACGRTHYLPPRPDRAGVFGRSRPNTLFHENARSGRRSFLPLQPLGSRE